MPATTPAGNTYTLTVDVRTNDDIADAGRNFDFRLCDHLRLRPPE